MLQFCATVCFELAASPMARYPPPIRCATIPAALKPHWINWPEFTKGSMKGLNGGKAEIDPVEIGDHVQQENKPDEAPRHLPVCRFKVVRGIDHTKYPLQIASVSKQRE